MHRPAYALLASLAVVAFATPTASAGPTPEQAAEIADRWIAAEAPGVANHCSGRMTFTYGRLDSRAAGWALGWILDPMTNGPAWDHRKCEAVIAPDMTAAAECVTKAHEQMHFVLGPDHVGPLDPRHPGARECYAPAFIPTTTRTTSGRVRTRKQIARSMRYKRQMAKIRARKIARLAARPST